MDFINDICTAAVAIGWSGR